MFCCGGHRGAVTWIFFYFDSNVCFILNVCVCVFSTVPRLHAGEGAERNRVDPGRLRQDAGKALSDAPSHTP